MAGTKGMTGAALLTGMAFTSGGSTVVTPPVGGGTPTPGVGYADSSLEYVVATADPSLPNALVFQTVIEGASAPTNPVYLWADSSTSPAIVKYWDTVASEWLPITQQTQAVAASLLTATFAAPAPGSSGSVTVANGALFLAGMPVAVFDNSGVQAFGTVASVTGNVVSFARNTTDTATAATGYSFTTANVAALAIVGQPGGVGATGADGATFARSTTIDSPGFTSPAISASVTIPLVSPATFITGDVLRVYDPTANSGAGGTDYYQVTSVSTGSVDATRVSVPSDTSQLGSGYSWTAGIVASFMGLPGPDGTDGTNGTNGTDGTDGADGSAAAVSGAVDHWIADGSTSAFTLTQSAVGSPTGVFIGGVMQSADGSGGSIGWTFAANTVTFASDPPAGAVGVSYVVAGSTTGPPAALFALNAPATISATTTADQAFAFTPSAGNEVPSDSLAVGDVLTFELIGNYTTSSSPPTLAPSFAFGGATILTGAAITLPASISGALGITGRVIATVIALGATGQIQFDGFVGIQTTSGGTYEQFYLGSALATVDTTTANVAAWSGAFGSVVAGNSVTVNQTTGLHAAAHGSTGGGGEGGSGGTVLEIRMGSTSYSLSNSYAQVAVPGQAPFQIPIPSAGTYLVKALLSISDASTGDDIRFKFRDSSAAAFVGPEEGAVVENTSGIASVDIEFLYAATGATILELYAVNNTAARGSLIASAPRISYLTLSAGMSYPNPGLSSFAPTFGESVSVTLTGTGLTGATGVKFNGTAATGVTVVSDTEITCTSPASFTDGLITVSTPGGTVTSIATFFASEPIYDSTILGESSLVSYWICNESSGSLADSKSGYTASPVGSPAYNQTSLTLDGESSIYMGAGSFNVTSGIHISYPFAIEFWIKGDEVGKGGLQGVVNWGDGSGGTINDEIYADIENLSFYNGGEGQLTYTNPMADGNPHYIVLNVDVSGNMIAYVDGTLDAGAASVPEFDINGMLIGVDQFSQVLYAYLSKIALYNDQLTTGQISSHYAAGHV